jgi:hypothetical protein
LSITAATATQAFRRSSIERSGRRVSCVLVEAHLAAGNCVEAVRQYRTYAALLKDALDLEPTTAFTRRVAHLMAR